MRVKYVALFICLFVLLLATLATALPDQSEETRIPILMYHKVDDNGTPNTAVITSEQFRDHLQALKQAGYETIFEVELLDYLKGKGDLPEKPIIITFDDGYLDNYEHAYPALKEYDMKASIYAIVSYRGKKPGWNEHFGWEHAKEMVESGHISIQSHSYASHHLIKDTRIGYLKGKLIDENGQIETDSEYEARVKNDLALSKQLLEENLGQQVVSFSYPFGHYTKQTEQWAEEAGYEMTLTVKKGLYRLGDPTWAIPRVTVDGNWSGEELIHHIESLY